ncbi:LysR family transcriptional regulator [Piscinibacter sp. XHJ-5]|uniref:LysR family transcriptional regulator n=1 Tax=Piscinibacter sp. XHJ-5 TaxID=3037797 RepID=UPI002452E84B|nr:LysR family transcriptional regulator [Piscinibacter sp. XHJ-5]
MDRLQSMKAFEQVVAENGFAAGARKMGMSPSVVTRLVVDLESHLGVRLLQRTTRRLVLTPAGETYLSRVRGILSDIESAEDDVNSHSREMSGIVRVAALPGMATHLVAPAIAEFRRLHPKVTIELHSDMLAYRDVEGHDLTLLTDQVPLPAGAVVRPVVTSESIFCASPDYLRRHGEPQAPQELLQHAYIRVVFPGLPSSAIRFVHENEPARMEEVGVVPVLCCNDHEAVLRGTVEGAGISSQVLQVAAPLLRAGRLQRVLTPWLAERFTLVACFASRRHVPTRTRAFLDHLVRHATFTEHGALPGGHP